MKGHKVPYKESGPANAQRAQTPWWVSTQHLIGKVREESPTVCDQLMHSSLIGWWWCNRAVSQGLTLLILRLLEKEMVSHSNILTSKILWTKESGELQPMGSHFLATKQKWCNSSCSCHIELTVVCAITAIMRSWRENQDSGAEAYQYLPYHYTPAIYWTLQLSTTRMIDCYMSVHSFKGNMNWIFYY